MSVIQCLSIPMVVFSATIFLSAWNLPSTANAQEQRPACGGQQCVRRVNWSYPCQNPNESCDCPNAKCGCS